MRSPRAATLLSVWAVRRDVILEDACVFWPGATPTGAENSAAPRGSAVRYECSRPSDRTMTPGARSTSSVLGNFRASTRISNRGWSRLHWALAPAEGSVPEPQRRLRRAHDQFGRARAGGRETDVNSANCVAAPGAAFRAKSCAGFSARSTPYIWIAIRSANGSAATGREHLHDRQSEVDRPLQPLAPGLGDRVAGRPKGSSGRRDRVGPGYGSRRAASGWAGTVKAGP
jgi:hypothetical protein